MLGECEEDDVECKESAATIFQSTWIEFYVESTIFKRRMKLHYRNADSFVRSMLKIRDVGGFLARSNVEQVQLAMEQLVRASSHINAQLDTCMNARRVYSVERRPGIVPRREMTKFKDFVDKREHIDYDEAQQTLERLEKSRCAHFSNILLLMREEYFPVLRQLELLMTIVQNEAGRGYHDKLEREYVAEDYEAEQLDKERSWWRATWSSFLRKFRRSLRWGLNNKFHTLVTISLTYFSFSSVITILAQSSYALIGYYRSGWTAVTSSLKPLCQYFGSWAFTFMFHKALSVMLERGWDYFKNGPIARLVVNMLKTNPWIFAGTKIASVGADVTQMIYNDMPDDAEIRAELGDGAVLFGQIAKTTVKFIFHMALIVAVKVLSGSFVVWCSTTGSLANFGASIWNLGNQTLDKIGEFVGFTAQTTAEAVNELSNGNVLENTKGILAWLIDGLVASHVAFQFAVPTGASDSIIKVVESVNSLSISEWSIRNVMVRQEKLDQFNEMYENFKKLLPTTLTPEYKQYTDAAKYLHERVNKLPTLGTDHAVEQSLGNFVQMINRTFSEVGNQIDAVWLRASKNFFAPENDQYFVWIIHGLLPIGVLVFLLMTALKSTKLIKLDPDPDPALEKGAETWSEKLLETNEQGKELELEVEQQQKMRKEEKAKKAHVAEMQRERMQRIKKVVENKEMLDSLENKFQKMFKTKQPPKNSGGKLKEDVFVEKQVSKTVSKKPVRVKKEQ